MAEKNQFANVKMFDMGKPLLFELPLAIFIFVQMATKMSMSNDIHTIFMSANGYFLPFQALP